MGSRVGVIKIAAKRCKLSLEEYLRRCEAGLKRCTNCRQWQPICMFHVDSNRWDGRATKCRFCQEQLSRSRRRAQPKRPRQKANVDARRELHALRTSPEYAIWRIAVFRRDGFACRYCGDDRGGNLHAHHIKDFANYPLLRFSIENGLTLCEPCHENEHRSKPRIRRRA